MYIHLVLKETDLRSLQDPPTYHQPDHMDNYRYYRILAQGDWGGVHMNSGIPNKAAYLYN